jgi:hypothetical protein
MTHFWHAVAPEGVALWHNYIRSRTPGPANPFHLDWMFFEDEAMNNQFLQLGLASGSTYMFTWGPMFNGDLTPSRSTLAVSKTMKQVQRPEAILRTMTPHTDPRVGIFTLDSRWALIRGRYGFYLQCNGSHDVAMGKGPYQAPMATYIKPPELALYRALSASGYAPKFVLPDEFAKCEVLFLPYVEAIDAETAGKVRQYVEGGGNLVPLFLTLLHSLPGLGLLRLNLAQLGGHGCHHLFHAIGKVGLGLVIQYDEPTLVGQDDRGGLLRVGPHVSSQEAGGLPTLLLGAGDKLHHGAQGAAELGFGHRGVAHALGSGGFQSECEAQDQDEKEDIEVLLRPLSDVPRLIRENRITHALVLAAFYRFYMETGENA